MPVLPLDHPEPFAATMGVMFYPGCDEEEKRKARAFAAHWLAMPVNRCSAAGHTVSPEALHWIAVNGGEELPDREDRLQGGIEVGNLFKVLFALVYSNPRLASWNNAAKIMTLFASPPRRSRSSLWDMRKRFLSVAHLWAAWVIRGGKFSSRPGVGYDGFDDFQAFLTEAEILRRFGQEWRPARAKSTPPLPSEVWRVPESWTPPTRRDGWPQTGVVPHLSLPLHMIAALQPTGRPKAGP